jgi:hypothetical protein
VPRTFRNIYKVPRAFLGPLNFDGGFPTVSTGPP